MLVRVEVFGFPFVVATRALIICLAAARPFLVVDEVCLLLPWLFVGVGRVWLEFAGIRAFEGGVVERRFVGLVERRFVALVSLKVLSSLLFEVLSPSALHVGAPFVRMVAKHVGVPSLHCFLDFGTVFDVVRTKAFLANQVGRRTTDIEIRILSPFVESQDIRVEFRQVVQKVRLVAGLMIYVHFLDNRGEGKRMRNGGIDLNLCDGADKFGDERNFMSYGVELEHLSHGVELEHLEFLGWQR